MGKLKYLMTIKKFITKERQAKEDLWDIGLKIIERERQRQNRQLNMELIRGIADGSMIKAKSDKKANLKMENLMVNGFTTTMIQD